MRPDVHAAALRAAAKVAFSMALIGCGSAASHDPSEDPAYGSDEGTAQTSQGELKKRRTPKGAVCDAGKPQATCAQQTTVAAKEACCEALLSKQWPGGDDWQTSIQPGEGGAELAACCQVVAEKVDRSWGNPDAGLGSWPRTQCCSLLGWQGSMACTPWGPPTPPAMKTKKKSADVQLAEVA